MSWAWWHVPIIPATWEAEAEENHLNLGGGGYSEPRLCLCTPACLGDQARLHLKTKQNNSLIQIPFHLQFQPTRLG